MGLEKKNPILPTENNCAPSKWWHSCGKPVLSDILVMCGTYLNENAANLKQHEQLTNPGQ